MVGEKGMGKQEHVPSTHRKHKLIKCITAPEIVPTINFASWVVKDLFEGWLELNFEGNGGSQRGLLREEDKFTPIKTK